MLKNDDMLRIRTLRFFQFRFEPGKLFLIF